jgi:hypothetical protein
MSAHNPIGSCCTRPRFNAVGGVDDRTTSFAVAGILTALAVVYVCALILL